MRICYVIDELGPVYQWRILQEDGKEISRSDIHQDRRTCEEEAKDRFLKELCEC